MDNACCGTFDWHAIYFLVLPLIQEFLDIVGE